MPELKTTTETTAAPSIPTSAPNKKKAPGLSFRRLFTKPGVSPYDEVEWELRLAQITDSHGNGIFGKKEVEIPKYWSFTATNILAATYWQGYLGPAHGE